MRFIKCKRTFLFMVMCELISMGFVGCVREINRVEDALCQSEMNRIHLEAVLRHFENDSLKYESAKYLISNMPYNHSGTSISRDADDEYRQCYHLYSAYGDDAFTMIDSLRNTGKLSGIHYLDKLSDLKEIDSTFLIMNIESAYRLKENLPWCRSLPDDIFNKYVLPYRIKDEMTSDWRDSIFDTYRPVIDSLIESGCNSPLAAARAVMEKWNEKEFRWTSRLPSGPSLGISNVFDKAGTCREFAHGSVYLMRALGIPAGVDMVPIRGENNSDHSWPFILDENGNTYVASTENPMWHPAKDFDIMAPKIYREEFGINESQMKNIGDKSNMPSFFSIPMHSDVTREYKSERSFDLIFKDFCSESKSILLLLPGNDRWVAVDISTDDRVPTFRNVAGGVVAWLGVSDKKGIHPISMPFVIDEETGSIRYINGGNNMDELIAFAKFPLNERNGDLVYRVVGGVIEGSDTPSFTRCDTILQITALPKRKQTLEIIEKNLPAYRYYRYKGAPDSYCNIAEVALFENISDTVCLKGRVFGTVGSWDNDTTHTYHKVFDGNIDTSFDYKEANGGWAAIDLGSPKHIRKVMFAPRNRDNYIRPGDMYELYYFDNCKWNSAGRIVANADSVSFMVPVGALYYLRNHTRGKDERIFEYDFKNHTQRFW